MLLAPCGSVQIVLYKRPVESATSSNSSASWTTKTNSIRSSIVSGHQDISGHTIRDVSRSRRTIFVSATLHKTSQCERDSRICSSRVTNNQYNLQSFEHPRGETRPRRKSVRVYSRAGVFVRIGFGLLTGVYYEQDLCGDTICFMRRIYAG